MVNRHHRGGPWVGSPHGSLPLVVLLGFGVSGSGCSERSREVRPGAAAVPAPMPAVPRPARERPVRRVAARPVDPDPPATLLEATARRLAGDDQRLRAGKLVSYTSRFSGQVHVEQKGSVRLLYVGRKDVIQTRMDMRHPARLLSPYLQCMVVALGFFAEPRKELRRVAMIGLGGGAWTRFFHARRPRLVFHSVDIDPLVVAIARRFFGVRDTATYRSYAMDGRRFLREAKRSYDLIVLDAFDAAANVPRQLVSVEFFRLIRRRLSPHGVVAINFLVHSRHVYSALVRTVRSVFPAVARFPLRRLSTHNTLLVAPKDLGRRPRPDVLRARVRRIQKRLGLSYSLARCVQTLDRDRLLAPTGPLLRDPPPPAALPR